jgi:hypothetical protein
MSPATSCQPLRPKVALNAIILQANLLLGASIFICIASDASASAQLTFNFTNQGTATPQMITGFAQAGALWSAFLKDPITINIRVGASALSPGILGHTDIFYDPFDYASVRTALVNDRLSSDDFSSTNALQAGPVVSMFD